MLRTLLVQSSVRSHTTRRVAQHSVIYYHAAARRCFINVNLSYSERTKLKIAIVNDINFPTVVNKIVAPTSLRNFSTTTTLSTTTTPPPNQQSKSSGGSDNKNDEESNIFLDNIGKIFLATIGTIILLLVRSSKGSTNRENLRDLIEAQSLLDPLEIDDLRVANSELDEDVFQIIKTKVDDAFPSGNANYLDFVSVVVQTMRDLKGDEFTVELGHLIDRVVIGIMEKNNGRGGGGEEENLQERKIPVKLLVVVLSLALNSSVEDRTKILYQVLLNGNDDGVGEDDIIEIVDYLQRSCQLPPGAQIVEADEKYPIQQYEIGSPRMLVAKAKEDLMIDDERRSQNHGYSLEDFNALLRSTYICAWGECYGPNSLKKK